MKKNRKSIYAVISLLIAGFIYTQQNNSDAISTESDNDGSFDIEVKNNFDFLPRSTTNQIAKHKYYTLSYNEKHEQAEWTAYALTPNHIKRIDRTRPYFVYDKKVKTRSANYRNYKKSGYDKGHLVPAGDMRFSLDAYNDTFFTSNISPQNHKFNAGIWNTLEQKTRYWAQKYGKIYVITGGVLKDGLRTIGQENVSVPNEFYKILLDYTEPDIKAIAFLIPNENVKKALYKYVVSIDYIEEKTGIDFFPALPDAIEDSLEASSDYKGWSFR